MNEQYLKLRKSVFNYDERKFLISKIAESLQEADLTLPANCDGFGRIHHFIRNADTDWIPDPLPIDPASKALNIMYSDQILTQVFQLALCNLNCWYCFVPNILKAANDNYSKWFSCDELVELILKNNQSPHVIDLSGGNPELVPEWLIEMMKSLEKHSLTKDYYLWSDDALSTDLFFEVLSPSEIDYVKNYKNYGKVCCFKGFDKYSCNFNTGKSLDFFDEQINRFSKYHNLNIDLYGYVTLTDETYEDIDNRISSFFDALQKIHPYLPLRTIPLKIKMFSPLQGAIYNKYATSISNQSFAIEAWKNQLNKRFTSAELSCNITEINLN